ncbi:MAG: triose-phosphate isomerase [Bacteroidia bacterium]|nr:triose-phosphate isomerase [Bacteroidia bacterium]MDW8303050.1 triose-phosphate isomerase [Bacteroidia bacterium]
MRRTKIIAGNWKMHLSYSEAIELTEQILIQSKDHLNDYTKIILFVPFVYAHPIAQKCAQHPHIYVGVQNMYYEKAGPYTGEISPVMLNSIGIKAVIIGHSERRNLFYEQDELLAKKVKSAIEHGLLPVFCVGETLQERETDKTQEVIDTQLKKGLFHLSTEEIKKVVIAYEPVWAIGTGKNATAEQAQSVHAYIRKQIEANYHPAISDSIPILYGGSLKPENAAELLSSPDVDGGLIGGASLKAQDFVAILRSVPQPNA